MKVQQLYTGCLAEAAYYIESDGVAAIIDPLRETQPYLDLLNQNHSKLEYIFETHFHADFVSGHLDLSAKTGAAIVYGPKANPDYDIIVAHDHQDFKIGKVTLRALHTPGHTPESTTYLLLDEAGEPHSIFTGDTLFLGDVGRPDLAIKSEVTQEDLAGMLFESLRSQIMPLPDHITVYPGHGAGSSCGKNLSKDTVDTLGNQKKTNYALNPDLSKEDFIKEVTEGIMPPPQYFPANAMMNKGGYDSFDKVLQRGFKSLDVDSFTQEVKKGALVLDTRPAAEFTKSHIPGSLFIGIDGNFAMWVGALITDLKRPIVFLAPEGREEEVVTRLARVGYDHAAGYLKGGIESWLKAERDISSIKNISPEDFETLYNQAEDKPSIVDVRKHGEFTAQHLENALFYPLDYIADHLGELEEDTQHYVHCAGGYRSVIAISILMQSGYTDLVNIQKGFGGLKKTQLPITEYVCPTTLA